MVKYFLAGGTSELGNRVVAGLTQSINPKDITCLVRSTSNVEFLKQLGVPTKIGDVTEPETFQGLLDQSTVYIDMTHPKYYHKSIDAVASAGVRRA